MLVASRNHDSELEAGDPISDNDPDDLHQFAFMKVSTNIFESNVDEHTYTEIGAHTTDPSSIFTCNNCNRTEVNVQDLEFKSYVRLGSIVANKYLDIERQRNAAVTIQETFRRKRHLRCLKRPCWPNDYFSMPNLLEEHAAC